MYIEGLSSRNLDLFTNELLGTVYGYGKEFRKKCISNGIVIILRKTEHRTDLQVGDVDSIDIKAYSLGMKAEFGIFTRRTCF